ncbi:hypothetical protein EDD66_11414 [Mobilisporobacter senegalensis]|uniref:Uncharacterized protein n=1 Tax=Mobilisporobacter senegalensis TaxID=1329262 RepID=A0A3N1XF28_9FIRM|nr:hypothetical protein [Mobilisporobacter senegalensis]ROR23407.1 hypothetical protein EDD66_11414 [Mobilisporobacter senegalensis]
MNKLMGFFELQQSNIPTIPWKEFKHGTKLDDSILWTIRTAVLKGDDLNLPRSVGEDAQTSMIFAEKMVNELSDNGIVVYYPYFVAEKSGTLNVYNDNIVIEAVKNDLWNLVTYSDRDVTIRINDRETNYDGNVSFLAQEELNEILKQIPKIRHMFRDYLTEGKSILLEWSFAFNCDRKKNSVGKKYLVFYEARTV